MKLTLRKNAYELASTIEDGDLLTAVPESTSAIQTLGDGDEPRYDDIAKLLIEGDHTDKGDADLAANLHGLLPLSRYEASRNHFWHHLSVDIALSYTNKRWGTKKDYRGRLAGRWSRNAVGRLWWWAELSSWSDGDVRDYHLTRKITNQRFQLNYVDQLAAADPRFAQALGEQYLAAVPDMKKAKIAQDDYLDEVWRQVKSRLGSIVLDALSDKQIVALVEECHDAAL